MTCFCKANARSTLERSPGDPGGPGRSGERKDVSRCLQMSPVATSLDRCCISNSPPGSPWRFQSASDRPTSTAAPVHGHHSHGFAAILRDQWKLGSTFWTFRGRGSEDVSIQLEYNCSEGHALRSVVLQHRVLRSSWFTPPAGWLSSICRHLHTCDGSFRAAH